MNRTDLLIRVLDSWDGWMSDTKDCATDEELAAVKDLITGLRDNTVVVVITRDDGPSDTAEEAWAEYYAEHPEAKP